MAITFTKVSMSSAPSQVGMQVAIVRPLDSETVELTVNAHNGSVTMDIPAGDLSGLIAELSAHSPV